MTRVRRRTMRMQTLWISIAGVLAVTIYAALAAVQILVWTPLASAPGLTIDQVGAELSGAGESIDAPTTITILGVGIVLALALGVIAMTSRAAPMIAAAGFLSLLMLGAPGLFLASFAPGMALADTFMISAGVSLPGVRAFYIISAFAAALLMLGGVVAVLRARAAPASA